MQIRFGATALLISGLLSLLSLRSLAAPAAAKPGKQRTVCTVTINSDHEKKTFQSHLPSKDFKFVELTDIGKTPGETNDDWFQKACRKKDLACDVLVVSGHFSGTFFGSSGLEMGLDEMERNSCRDTCDGILKTPKEAFLFGCNTLAGKEKDSRTFEEYVEIQVKDGIDRPVAVRNAQARYGAMGSSFKDRMRRVFTNVPNIYGFDSVGPTGERIKPFLDNYFNKVPNYLNHIQTAEARQVASLAMTANSSVQNINNTVLADSLKGFAFAQCYGVQAGTQDAAIRREICQLYDLNLTLAQRSEAAAAMLRKPNRLAYLPSVLNFIRSNESEIDSDPSARAALNSLLNDQGLSADAAAILNNPKESPFTKVDILRMKLALGKIDQPTFETQIRTALAPELRKLDQATIDLACSLRKEHGFRITVSSNDIDMARLKTNAGVSAFACLRTQDPKITAQVISTFRVMTPQLSREGVAYGLEALMGLPDYAEERAEQARRYVGSSDTRLDAYGRMALAASGTADERASAIQGLIALPVDAQEAAFGAIGKTGEVNEPLAGELVQSLKYGDDQSYYGRVQAITRVTPVNSPLWKELAATVDAEGVKASASAANYLRDLPKPPTSMAFWALQNMRKEDGYNAYYTSVLAKMEMSPGMVSKLADQLADPETKPEYAARLRYIIRHQKNAQFTPAQRQALESGTTLSALCEPTGSNVTCREVKR